MKYKFGIIALLTATSMQYSFACADFNRNHQIDSDELFQFTMGQMQITDGVERNQNLANCYKKNRTKLSANQVETMLTALFDYTESPMAYTTVDKESIQDSISEDFSKLQFHKSKPAEYVQIAKWQHNALDTNRMIENYYNQKVNSLKLDDVQVLLDGLVNVVSDNKYDKEETQDRISMGYFHRKAHSLMVPEVIVLARKQFNSLKRNMVLEKYAEMHIRKLSWGDLNDIIDGMYPDNNAPIPAYHLQPKLLKYLRHACEERLTKLWERYHNR